MKNKPKPSMPPNNTIPNLDHKFDYIIEGVYYWRNDEYYGRNYNRQTDIYNLYGVNKTSSINIFFDESSGTAGGNAIGNGYSFINRAWARYVLDKSVNEWERWGLIHLYPWTFNHEIGHNLGLSHTMKNNSNGECNTQMDDGCDDTPTIPEIQNVYGFDPCCGWGGNDAVCTNNMMDREVHALTPCQLGAMHYTILNNIPTFRLCHFTDTTGYVNPNQLGWPQILFQARILYVGSLLGTPTVLENGERAIFIGEQYIDLRPGFEAQLGSEFEIRFATACN
ncbi:MAG: zinc-dependent metalloprotease family protein [Cytophagales bacterium]|nr:zinc-dependent metalloprotease family protein [Cytophagales bacterium]